MGPRHVHSVALSSLEEAAVVEFQRRTLLPLDDVWCCLRQQLPQLPQLSRSALHRCLLRHSISHLPSSLEHASKRGHFAGTKIGFVHVDACEVRSAEGKLHLFLAVDGVTAQLRGHAYDRVCRVHGIVHKVTRPYHPSTNGQAKRMRRTIKGATLRWFHHERAADPEAHVAAFVTAYNFAKYLKALRWRTPYQAICDAWCTDRSGFRCNPHHLIQGPYT